MEDTKIAILRGLLASIGKYLDSLDVTIRGISELFRESDIVVRTLLDEMTEYIYRNYPMYAPNFVVKDVKKPSELVDVFFNFVYDALLSTYRDQIMPLQLYNEFDIVLTAVTDTVNVLDIVMFKLGMTTKDIDKTSTILRLLRELVGVNTQLSFTGLKGGNEKG